MTRLLALAMLALAMISPGCVFGDPVRVEILEVAGFNDDVRVWMPFRLRLALTNPGRNTVAVRALFVEPDFEGFNEAYGMGTPHDLDRLLRIEPGRTVTYDVVVTLLNALQLQPGSHRVSFRVQVETNSDEQMTVDFPMTFEHHADPAKRVLRR